MRRLLAAAGMAVVLHGLLLLSEGSWLCPQGPSKTASPRAVTIRLVDSIPSSASSETESSMPAEPQPRAFEGKRPGVVFSSPLPRPAKHHGHKPPDTPHTPGSGSVPAKTLRIPGGQVEGLQDPSLQSGGGTNAPTASVSEEAGKPAPKKPETSPPLVEAVPIYRENPSPSYPRLARRRGYEGTVVLEVLVTEEGRVGALDVAQSSGHSMLDKAAVHAVKSWRFKPGRKGDRPVSMRVHIPVRFRLQ